MENNVTLAVVLILIKKTVYGYNMPGTKVRMLLILIIFPTAIVQEN